MNADRSDGSFLLAAMSFLFLWPLRDPYTLVGCRTAVAGWKKFEPDSTKLPCPWVAVLFMAQWSTSLRLAVGA